MFFNDFIDRVPLHIENNVDRANIRYARFTHDRGFYFFLFLKVVILCRPVSLVLCA